MQHICAIDIGYSGLKIAAGAAGEPPHVLMRPSGAAPVGHVAEDIGLPGLAEPPVWVDVGGARWAAAIDPSCYDGWQRSLHEDYVATGAYRALAIAGMVLQARATGRREIDMLVTGLPVSQIGDAPRVQAVKRTLAGRHPHHEGNIVVRAVTVLAQPLGAYAEMVTSTRDEDVLARADEGTVLVIDPGFYSFDWALLARGQLRQSASGTSLEAMSVALEQAARAAAADHGGRPQPALLEAAARAGRERVLQNGTWIEVANYVQQGATKVVPTALEALRTALRRESLTPDLVLLAGGGGVWFREPLCELFPKARVLMSTDPATANVRGFFVYA